MCSYTYSIFFSSNFAWKINRCCFVLIENRKYKNIKFWIIPIHRSCWPSQVIVITSKQLIDQCQVFLQPVVSLDPMSVTSIIKAMITLLSVSICRSEHCARWDKENFLRNTELFTVESSFPSLLQLKQNIENLSKIL